MASEEAIVRARIAALKNVIAAREGKVPTAKYVRSAPPRAAPYAPYRRLSYPKQVPKTRNLTWKAPDIVVPAPSLQYNIGPRPRPALTHSTSAPTAARTEYCLFYNRFGVCNKKNACLFIHDSRKVAVCRKFLRGECTDSACTLSHERDQNKMPVCTLFLQGRCSREDCPYRHVNVSRDAAVCDAFLKGYCPEGELCRLKHELPSKKGGSGASATMRPVTPASVDLAEPVSSDIGAPVAAPTLSIRPTIRFTPRVAGTPTKSR
ncbi:Smad-interacting and CPSF-like protein [Achlya hypogyna]|uniref:Smad-interacting and CPSF-like protein n=1 Tax=Achlya hypogyna TaxID=1202772 RepID=A0A1V9YVP3_ACHHY|nr:Smad-interacting and CPSF-like protein [Achlya hypogyna]